MRKRRFTEEQIVSILKEQQGGAKVMDLCRKHGISEAKFYTWRTKYNGVGISEVRRMRQLGFIDPGKPVQNANIESFNGCLQDECLNQALFFDMENAQSKIESWRLDYNQNRLHNSLRNMTLEEFVKHQEVMASAS